MKLLIHRLLLVSLAFACSSSIAWADVSLSSLFSDHMVLQRNIKVPVWGKALAGEEITVEFRNQSHQAKADSVGKWAVELEPLKANAKPHELVVRGKNTITIKDVLVGEVWIGSGQSNMEWTMSNTHNAQEAMAAANQPNIRLFLVPKVKAAQPAEDLVAEWKACSPEAVKSFSAVSYFFARELHNRLDVPVGMIASSWGGSRIEPWIPTAEPTAGYSEMYNAMIAPIVRYAMRGAIWYQGESNVNDGEGPTYRDKMENLINSWRQKWGLEDFSFYYVSIAPFKDFYQPGNLPRLWHYQSEALKIPHTGMAVVSDIGNLNDIHPRNKLDVGRRLALWALAKNYGQDELVYSGPFYRSMDIDGNKIRLHFAHSGSGLIARDDQPLNEFQIAAADGKFVPALAAIDGETVVVSAKEVPQPENVRFAWHKLSNANLSNKEGLPAAPFTTENWRGGTGE